ncbi:MAG: YheU family protein [Pseudomonadales bacterium]|nr:YheU family protein [Pseudomonadales bacterium]MDG1442292.1 YheU family protein [Pseudomonadales bacterium]
MSNFMVVPWSSLSEDALTGIIEDFVSREGTEYGASDISLGQKVQQIRYQLECGDASIVYDAEHLSCSIALTRELPDI